MEPEPDVEEREECVDELEEDEFAGEVSVVLLLRSVVLPLREFPGQLEVAVISHENEEGVAHGRHVDKDLGNQVVERLAGLGVVKILRHHHLGPEGVKHHPEGHDEAEDGERDGDEVKFS